jgi:hypothetical protein
VTAEYSGYWPPSPLWDSEGASGPSDPPGPTIDALSSPSRDLYPQSRGQDDHPYGTSSHRGQVEGAAQNPVATQGQYATTGKASPWHERKVTKKVKDMERKRTDRSNNARDNARICELLNISLAPINTLSNRSECWLYYSSSS